MQTLSGVYEFEYIGTKKVVTKDGKEYELFGFLDSDEMAVVMPRVSDDIKNKVASLKKGDKVAVKMQTQENNGKVYRTITAIKVDGAFKPATPA